METQTRMPVLFIGHGSPMNAIENNEYSLAWKEIGRSLPTPRAIVSISAHWETAGTRVTAMGQPKTIHDFYGFPRALYEKQYPAPGSVELTERIRNLIKGCTVSADLDWGLDHGTWSVLCHLYPQANIPVVQLSMDQELTGESHYKLGQELEPLRDENILILGSGNLVHNLQVANFEVAPYEWALEYDEKVRDWILSGNHEKVVHHERNSRIAALSVNTAEHYLPLLYVLGAGGLDGKVEFFCEKVMAGSISMRCVKIG